MESFQNFKTVENEMHMISPLFTCNAPCDVQLELIDLQSDALLVDHFRSISLLELNPSLEKNFHHMRRHVQKILVLFGSAYVYEQTFSVLKFNKSKHRSTNTDVHLSAVLHISTTFSQISVHFLKPKTDLIFLNE